jgi:hypothetical protein
MPGSNGAADFLADPDLVDLDFLAGPDLAEEGLADLDFVGISILQVDCAKREGERDWCRVRKERSA